MRFILSSLACCALLSLTACPGASDGGEGEGEGEGEEGEGEGDEGEGEGDEGEGEGEEAPPPGSCRTTADDCDNGADGQCTPPNTPQCGGAPPPLECDDDSNCGVGSHCETAVCGARTCVVDCNDTDNLCPDNGTQCEGDGVCRLPECTSDDDCRDSARVCSPIGPNADEQGCAPVACAADADCAGVEVCVEGSCAETFGTCEFAVP